MYSVYRFRHIFSWLPVLMAAGWVFLNQHSSLKIEPRYDESTMELALVELPKPAPPQPEEETLSEPEPQPISEKQSEPKPQPINEKLPEPEPQPINEKLPEPEATAPSPQPVAPPPKPKPKPAPKPATPPAPKAAPKPQPKPKPAVSKAAKPAETVQPARRSVAAPAPAAPKPAAPRVNSAAIENGWVAGLRSDLETQKRYPSGRQASLERPEGVVEIWLEVDRSGRVLASGISSKARSMLLNRAAMSSLQSIRQVKPFPADAFAGQNSRRFTATLNYRAP